MRPQTLIVLLVVVGSGLAAAILSYQLVLNQQKTEGSKKIVMTVRNIAQGEKLLPEHLKMEDFPVDKVTDKHFTSMDLAVDRVALFPIPAETPLVQAFVSEKGAAPGMSAVLPKGTRAMSIPIKNYHSVAGFVAPKTKVDLMHVVTLVFPGKRGRLQTARLLLQNVEVLAVNTDMNPSADTKGQRNLDMVTFAVTPQQAEKLSLAQEVGSIHLVLRGMYDDDVVKLEGTTIENLYGEQAKTGPARDRTLPPSLMQLVEDKSSVADEIDKMMSSIEVPPVPTVEEGETPQPAFSQSTTREFWYTSVDGEDLFAVEIDSESPKGKNLRDRLRKQDSGSRSLDDLFR